jgi:outer membrane protein assembly factor BamE (lipoprotein component of BamABCDE complex)
VSSAAPASGTQRVEIRVGMTAQEVRKLLGDPQAEMVFGEKTRWTYPALTVVFVGGKVTDVKF